IGASNFKVIFQFMSEALTFTILAAAIGLIIGVVGGSPVTNTLVTNSTNTSSNSSSPPGSVSIGGGPGAGGTFQRVGGGLVSRNVGGLKNTITNIHANIGWSILAYGLGAAVAIAVIGSGLAGWLIAKVRPAEVMRSE
ncbi:MAG TPA: hypothetical protein VH234_03825, partial [Candidatus Saccharimonadales bacterium]|nr:hypothetical protein [Candidatus Saccharimonadales bacterium]